MAGAVDALAGIGIGNFVALAQKFGFSRYQTLRAAGGAFIAVEHIVDDGRRENVFGLMMSLHMLIQTGDGFDYTGSDFRGWCELVGFRSVELLHLAGPASAAIAYKSSHGFPTPTIAYGALSHLSLVPELPAYRSRRHFGPGR